MTEEQEPFLNAIYQDPDQHEPLQIYSDWLAERGDSRGEFIQLQLQLEQTGLPSDQRKELVSRESSLLKQNKEQWLKELAPELTENWAPSGQHFDSTDLYKFTFEKGFLSKLRIEFLFPDFASKLAQSSQARMLKELVLLDIPGGEELTESFEVFQNESWGYEDSPSLDALATGEFPNLRRLEIHSESHLESSLELLKMLASSTRLEDLDLSIRGISMGKLFQTNMPSLKSLTVYHQSDYPIEQLAANSSLTQLEKIDFFPHAVEPGDEAYLNIDSIRQICQSQHLKNLRHLRLESSNFGNDGIEEMIQSGLLARLESLQIPHGSVTDTGAQLLADANLENLKRLDLTGNYLTDAGTHLLVEKEVSLQSGEQRNMASFVHEEQLYIGDWE
ncbi:MAG: TIGR02996 domain-containing protein [Rubripirellula sp.]